MNYALPLKPPLGLRASKRRCALGAVRIRYAAPAFGTTVSGRRYYAPSQGRFLGRDPVEEKGGLHLYAFCGNDGINRWDLLGMLYGDTHADNPAIPEGFYDIGDGATASPFGYSYDPETQMCYEDFLAPNGPRLDDRSSVFTSTSTINPVTVTVVTEIRPPYIEAGVKSTQTAVVDPYSGNIISSTFSTGTTNFLGVVNVPARDIGTSGFAVTDTVRNGTVYISMQGETGSWFVPLNINYNFTIGYNSANSTANLNGTHDGFPSCVVTVNNSQIYNFQQISGPGGVFALAGSSDTTAHVPPTAVKPPLRPAPNP